MDDKETYWLLQIREKYVAVFKICKLAKPDKMVKNKKILARLIQLPILNTKWTAKLQELPRPICPEHNYYFGFTPKQLADLKRKPPKTPCSAASLLTPLLRHRITEW